MKNIVISGGSEGLGLATASLLSKNNNVYILARSEKKLKQASSKLGCNFKVCDVSNWDSVQTTVRQIEKECGKIDVLINNAGIWIQGSLIENDPKRISEVINVNTTGTIYLTKAVLKNMQRVKTGQVINVISQAGFYAKSERSVYNASKWAITGFTKSMALEVSKYNIKVMGVYPGKMDTKMFKKMDIKKDMSDAIKVKEVAKAIKFMIDQKEHIYIPELGINYL